MTLRDLARIAPEGQEIFKTIVELADQPDRTAAIVAAAFLERAIENAITSRLKHRDEETLKGLFEDASGPLATFDAKIRVGYALDLFGPTTRGDFDRIRKIRNAFAHALIDVTFDTELIAAELAKLSVFVSGQVADMLKNLEGVPTIRRRKYVAAVGIYYFNLTVFGVHPPEAWPESLGGYVRLP